MSSGERKSYLSVSADGPTFFFDDVGLMKKLNCFSFNQFTLDLKPNIKCEVAETGNLKVVP